MSPVQRIGVVGSGQMGAGIAEVAARAGLSVVLRSRSRSAADDAVAALDRSLARQVEKGRLATDERTAIVGRVASTASLADLAGCEIVIESIVEDLAAKRQLFTELDQVCPHALVLATNTSTLPVMDMASHTSHPERVCGIHFFNPAPTMTLVEIVRPLTASKSTIETARAFALACGKDPIDVQDRAGFVVNALLFPYLNNAVRLYERGTASMADIDTAMKGGCNFPMGPFALLDLIGLDTSVAILQALYGESRDPNVAPAPTLLRLVEAGRFGRKSGRGFYDYGR